MRKTVQFTNIVLSFLVIGYCLLTWPLYTLIGLVAMIIGLGIYDLFQKKHTILRNFPVIGHLRYLFEMIAPEIHQYFVESDTDGRPISRNHKYLPHWCGNV